MCMKDIEVKNQVGLHARPATFFIQKANEYKSSIWVEKEERRVNAKSLLGILSLGIVGGAQIRIIASGSDEQIARTQKAFGAEFRLLAVQWYCAVVRWFFEKDCLRCVCRRRLAFSAPLFLYFYGETKDEEDIFVYSACRVRAFSDRVRRNSRELRRDQEGEGAVRKAGFRAGRYGRQ